MIKASLAAFYRMKTGCSSLITLQTLPRASLFPVTTWAVLPDVSVCITLIVTNNFKTNRPITVNFFLGEKLGRRKTIWLAMGLVIVGAVLQTSAFTVPHLVVGRVVTGFGTGLKTSTVPM